MHRRDFLMLRHPMSPRTAELSCERLHMAYIDSQQSLESSPAADDAPSFEEPAAVRPHRDVDAWLRDLESQLHDVDVIRVSGAEWLRPDDLRVKVEAVLKALEKRGTRVER